MSTALTWLTTRKKAVLASLLVLLICGCGRPAWLHMPRFGRRAGKLRYDIKPTEDISFLLSDRHWQPVSLRVIWGAKLPSGARFVTVGARNLIVVDQNDMVYALERRRGIILWKHDIGAPVDALSYGAGDVLVLTRDRIWTIKEDGGKVRWRRTLDFVPSSELVRSQFGICSSGWGKYVYSMSAEDGMMKWREKLGSNVVAAVLDAGTRVYAATENGRLHALSGSRGKEEWDVDLRGRVLAGLAADDERVFVGSTNKILSACSKLGEGVMWTVRTTGPITTAPVVMEKAVYVYSDGDGLYAVNTANGKIKWKMEGSIQVLSIGKDKMFLLRRGVEDAPHEVVVVDTESGKERASVKAPGLTTFAQNLPGPEVFGISEAGEIFAMTEL